MKIIKSSTTSSIDIELDFHKKRINKVPALKAGWTCGSGEESKQ